jgi:DNA-binding CsgD family transcriptional regulator
MNATAVLTRRESQVAELPAWGGTKKDVARHCGIAIRTVENITRSVYEKADVTKVNELSAWYFCTHFHISFQLSPLLRRTMALMLLLLFVSTFHEPANQFVRCRRVESCRRVSRRNESDTPYLLEI